MWKHKMLLQASADNVHTVIFIHVLLTKASHFNNPLINGAGKCAPAIEDTVKLHGKECGCIISIQEGRNPIPASIISFKIILGFTWLMSPG